MNKQELRREVRARFPGAEARAEESARICANILEWPLWQSAETVGLYVPLRREADVFPLIGSALADGKTVLLPRVEGPGVMTFRRIRDVSELVPGSYSIPEPAQNAETVPAEKLDLLLVPLEALDRTGMRLGKGGGFYDRILPKLQCPAAGVLLKHQWVDRVPSEAWDMPLDYAADADGISRFHQ